MLCLGQKPKRIVAISRGDLYERFALKAIRDSATTAINAIDLYNSVIDRIVPWKEFNETLVELDKFRDDYTDESALLIAEIRTLMEHGIDAYFAASQSVYEWCGLAMSNLRLYIRLFELGGTAAGTAQKTLLVNILNDGVEKMSAAQDSLGKSSQSFNRVFGKLSILLVRLESEFDEKSEFYQTKVKILQTITAGAKYVGQIPGLFGLTVKHLGRLVEENITSVLAAKLDSITQFYNHLKAKVQQAFHDIYKTKSILNNEIERIGELKVQTQQTATFVSLDDAPDIRDLAIQYAHQLIDKCITYRQSHIDEMDRY